MSRCYANVSGCPGYRISSSYQRCIQCCQSVYDVVKGTRCCRAGMTMCQVEPNIESVHQTTGVYSVVKVYTVLSRSYDNMSGGPEHRISSPYHWCIQCCQGVYSVVKVYTVLSRWYDNVSGGAEYRKCSSHQRCIQGCQGALPMSQVDQNIQSVRHTTGVCSVVQLV